MLPKPSPHWTGTYLANHLPSFLDRSHKTTCHPGFGPHCLQRPVSLLLRSDLGFSNRVLGEETIENIGVFFEHLLIAVGAKVVGFAFVC